MFGLDEWIAGVSDEGSIAIVLLVAILLGLRHATDPDHLAAVSTLVVSGRERATRAAARLGAAWGLGHAVTLVAFGVPILLAERYLPDLVQRGAETTVAALIAFLAVRLLVRWRHGAFASRRSRGRCRTGMRCARRRVRSASGSCTGWVAARASASCCSQRSRRGHSRSSRSSCWRCSPPCR